MLQFPGPVRLRDVKAASGLTVKPGQVEELLAIRRETDVGEGALIHFLGITVPSAGRIRIDPKSFRENRNVRKLTLDAGRYQVMADRRVVYESSAMPGEKIPIYCEAYFKRADGSEVHVEPPEMPLNVSVVGNGGPGGGLVWDRPPGRVSLEIFARDIGGFLVHPAGADFTVEAGKTYYIEYDRSLKCTVRESP